MAEEKVMLIDAFGVDDAHKDMSRLFGDLGERSSNPSNNLKNIDNDGKEIELDRIEQRGKLWLFNFGLLKKRGPGKKEENESNIKPMQIDGRYAYETAMLYRGDPKGINSLVLVEFVQKGARIGRIVKYLSDQANRPREEPIIFKQKRMEKNKVKNMITNLQNIKELNFKGTMADLEKTKLEGLRADLRRGVGKEEYIARVELRVYAEPVHRSKSSWRKYAQGDNFLDGDNRVIIIGRNYDDDDWERFNVFDPKEQLKQVVSLPDIRGDDRETATVEERWKALKKALSTYDRAVR